jgi:hypothetical protein
MRPEIRLDVLIKKEEDYYLAHCLQFDLVVTDDTVEGVKKAILDTCVAHIRSAIDNNNLDYLFSPAPQEAWAQYLTLAQDPHCVAEMKALSLAVSGAGEIPAIPPFIIQEVLCNERASGIA